MMRSGPTTSAGWFNTTLHSKKRKQFETVSFFLEFIVLEMCVLVRVGEHLYCILLLSIFLVRKARSVFFWNGSFIFLETCVLAQDVFIFPARGEGGRKC